MTLKRAMILFCLTQILRDKGRVCFFGRLVFFFFLLIYFGRLFAAFPCLVIKMLYALWVETRTGLLTLFYSKSELSNSTIIFKS